MNRNSRTMMPSREQNHAREWSEGGCLPASGAIRISYSHDGFAEKKSDYTLANPSLGVEWKPPDHNQDAGSSRQLGSGAADQRR